MKNKNAKKRAPLNSEQLLKREKRTFKTKIRNIFTGSGFTYIPTNDQEMIIGLRKVEIDSIFIYENIWLVCEDTVRTSNIRDHIRIKNEAISEINKNLSDFINKLTEIFPQYSDLLNKYDKDRLKIFGLYISKYELSLSKEDYELFNNLKFVEPQTLAYFQWLVKGIKFSARNEMFRFLNLKNKDIGLISSSSSSAEITAPIIYPKEFTGLKNKVRVVSFMMSAEDLLNTCYVLRKDNWEESIWLYQRLIDNNRLKKVREFIERKGEAFYNNIIVGLPDNIRFRDASGNFKTIDEISDLEGNCQLIIPKELNSICVIDGQHRIYAHYESGVDSKQERIISQLRKQLHLLVTGLVFPKEMKKEDRAKIQSEIFDDINSNAKSVPQNILLQIKRIKNPIADESLAQFVIEKLNKQGIFKNKLQISSLDAGKIKTASIVRFALRYLVTVTPVEGKQSLFNYWTGDKDALLSSEDAAIQEYVDFCVAVLRDYFGAIVKNLKTDWNNPESKLLTVISLNGFIIALTRQLSVNGVNNFEFYDKVFTGWNFDFSKEGFPYTSSQYRKFSSEILRTAFKLSEEQVESSKKFPSKRRGFLYYILRKTCFILMGVKTMFNFSPTKLQNSSQLFLSSLLSVRCFAILSTISI